MILQGTYTDQIAELSVQKNQLSSEINLVLDELTSLQDELSSVKLKHREAEGMPLGRVFWRFHMHLSHVIFLIHLIDPAGIQFKIKQKRKEIEDNHEQQRTRLAVTEKAKLQNLWNNINELNLSMTKNAKSHAAELQEMEAKHQAALNELNTEVELALFVTSTLFMKF